MVIISSIRSEFKYGKKVIEMNCSTFDFLAFNMAQMSSTFILMNRSARNDYRALTPPFLFSIDGTGC